MSRIKIIEMEEVVGEVYNDAWNDGIVRVSLDDWDGMEKKMSEESLMDLIYENDYNLVEFGHSGDNARIYEEFKKYICKECNSKAMFDTKRMEYYCPRCEL